MNQGITVHHITSAEGQAVLAAQKLSLTDMAKAIAAYQAAEKVQVATPIGVSREQGFFYSTEPGWRPDQPGAFVKQIGFIPWVQIHEILGNMQSGTTGSFLDSDGNRN
jgi:hypothetical protein